MNTRTIYNVGIVKSSWHASIVDVFSESCREALEASIYDISIDEYQVPGVVEIPLFCQKLVDTGSVDLMVVTGLIADHGVYRHDFVARTVLDATMKVQLDSGIPIIYGILTPQDFLSEGREEFFSSHFVVKGREAADACLKTIENDRRLASRLKKTG